MKCVLRTQRSFYFCSGWPQRITDTAEISKPSIPSCTMFPQLGDSLMPTSLLPLIVLALTASALAANLSVGTATAAPGQKATGYLEVAAGSDLGTNIPVVVVKGTKPGPTLALVAGAHGTEYASIIALESLMQS